MSDIVNINRGYIQEQIMKEIDTVFNVIAILNRRVESLEAMNMELKKENYDLKHRKKV